MTEIDFESNELGAIKKLVEKKYENTKWVLENKVIDNKESLEAYLETLQKIIDKIILIEVNEEDVK